jgi:hypothetical protein
LFLPFLIQNAHPVGGNEWEKMHCASSMRKGVK